MSTAAPAGGPGRPSAPRAGVRFRSAGPADAAALLALKRDLDHETSFMLLEPGERSEGTQEVAADLEALAGIASGLLAEVETWALARGMHRLEFTVMAHNERAHALYERMGFVVEGRRHECLLVDGRLVDELYMAKLLPYPAPVGAER